MYIHTNKHIYICMCVSGRENMDGSSLAQCAQHLAVARELPFFKEMFSFQGLYSPELSEEVARQLAGNPWSFTAADLQRPLVIKKERAE